MSVSIPDCFMIAFTAGFIFGLVYEAIRIIRLILKFRIAVFICDIAFFILAAFAVCRLSEFLGNYIRLYTVLGFGTGVFTYIVTIGRLFNVLESAASVAWRRTLGRLFRKIGQNTKNFFAKIAHKTEALFGKIHEYWDKHEKNRKERLNLSDKMLYNNEGNNIFGEDKKAHVIKAKVRKSP